MKISLRSIGIANTLLIVSLISVADISAQWSHDFEHGVIPVVIDGDTLQNPWVGGLTAPQWSPIDFDFDEDEDGIEMIGLERLKEDVEALQKHKINGSMGGLKRAENYRNKQEEEQQKEQENKEEIIIKNEAVKEEVKEHQSIKLPSWFLEHPIKRQKESVRHMMSRGIFKEKGERGEKMKQMMIEHINGKMR